MLENFECRHEFKFRRRWQIIEVVICGEEVGAEFILSEEVIALIAHEPDKKAIAAGKVQKPAFTLEVLVDDPLRYFRQIEISADQAYIQCCNGALVGFAKPVRPFRLNEAALGALEVARIVLVEDPGCEHDIALLFADQANRCLQIRGFGFHTR